MKNILLSTVPFSAENDTLTPTQKIKRHQAREMYKQEILALYSEPLPASS